jgi:drug/metabolite transporter (DMT)-like permease
MSTELSPIILALIMAFLFSLGVQFQHIGFSVINSRTETSISITTVACIYWLLSPSLSFNLAVAATRYLGQTLSTTLSSTTSLYGAALGVWWLGEVFTWQIALGTFGIISAVLLLSFKNLHLSADWRI